jgi:hypothetical protein
MPSATEGTVGAEGVEGAVIAGTVIGGFRIGAPAANTQAGTASVAVIVVTAKKSRRHMEASHGVIVYYSVDDRSVQR